MKIAVIAHLHYAIKQPYAGGLEAHTDLLVRRLAAIGHDVTLYAKAGTKTTARIIPIFDGDAMGGQNKQIRSAYIEACDHIELQNYDLVFNNSLNSYPFEWHTLDMPPMLTVFHTPPLHELTNVIEVQPTQSNRIFIAVSEFTANQWQKYCASDINIVSNGIDMSNWRPYKAAPKTTSAIWVGRITPEKGLHVAIQAALLADVPLTICGNMYDRAYFADKIEPSIDGRSITYAGHLDQAAVNELYGKSSVALVTPLWDEPFGFVTVEALASGTPVAGLDNGATASIVRDRYGTIATSDSPEDLAAAIKRALKVDRNTCALYAHKNYSVEAMVSGYLGLMPDASSKIESLQLV